MTAQTGIDQALIQGYLDNLGTATVGKMLDLYIQQSAIYINEINTAVANQSQEQWQDRCHKMKGAAASVGLVDVHKHMASIEKSTVDWSEKEVLMKKTASLNNEAVDSFKQWLASL